MTHAQGLRGLGQRLRHGVDVQTLQAATGFFRQGAEHTQRAPLPVALERGQRLRGVVDAAEHDQGLRGTEQAAFGAAAREQAQREQGAAGEQRVDQHDRARERRQARDQQAGRQGERRDAGGGGEPAHVGQAGVAPRRAVDPEREQAAGPYRDRQRQADQHDVGDVGRRVVAQQAETEHERRQPGERDRDRVVQRRLPADAAGRRRRPSTPRHACASTRSRPRCSSAQTRSSCAASRLDPDGRQTPPANSAPLTSSSWA
ncbi:hypothetical protein GALL_440610 [mine drainage metagenome]|uniref:Uncharacterized protein n=1 Tax=mine drainage metagenome TaxID=410659 RepID=A0A1J5PS27_9ZZZZ